MGHLIRFACGLALSAVLFAALACGSASSPSSPSSPTVPVDPGVLPSMSLMLADKTIGSASARHEIIEYSSFTCPHCANFQAVTMPQLKAQYIDTKVARFVFRNWPRDTSVDLTAAMLARCAGDRYFDAVDTLFRTQSTWAGASDPIGALGSVMRNFGMSQQVIDACKASTTLRDGILQMKQDGLNQYHFQGVPAFIVDGVRMVPDGDRDISAFASLLG